MMNLPTTAFEAREPAATSNAQPRADNRPLEGPQQVKILTARDHETGHAPESKALLQRRLLILALTATAAKGTYALVSATVAIQTAAGNPLGHLIARPWLLISAASSLTELGLALFLWRKHACSWNTLRFIEILLFGLITLWCCDQTLLQARVFQESFPPGNLFVNALMLYWFGLIVIYGVMIPNTARRCAVCVAGMVVTGSSVMILSWAWYSVPLERFVPWSANMLIWFFVASVLTVLGAHRIESLRQQVLEARKLGQYQLKKRLGAGGMGEVYLAEHMLLRRPCAVKLIRPDRTGNLANLLRFEREVQATATLTHPNTVQVYDYGHAADGTFYYVMEYLPGLTLDQLVKRHGPLPPERAIHFLQQVCQAMAEAHAIGLIHRDIKPGNVMVCERGGTHDTAKLLDFGLVLLQSEGGDGDKLTQEGTVPGTPAYMSPEQAGGQEHLDPRSDIYGVGALAYFLLTGQPPFAGRSGPKMMAAHLYETPMPLTQHRTDVPADLEAVVLRCLAKEPVDRYADAGSLRAALASCHAACARSSHDAANWWRLHASLSDDGIREVGAGPNLYMVSEVNRGASES